MLLGMERQVYCGEKVAEETGAGKSGFSDSLEVKQMMLENLQKVVGKQ